MKMPLVTGSTSLDDYTGHASYNYQNMTADQAYWSYVDNIISYDNKAEPEKYLSDPTISYIRVFCRSIRLSDNMHTFVFSTISAFSAIPVQL